MTKNKIDFLDYKNYPPELFTAHVFRDLYDDLPDGAFFAATEEMCLYDDLVALADWEAENVIFPSDYPEIRDVEFPEE